MTCSITALIVVAGLPHYPFFGVWITWIIGQMWPPEQESSGPNNCYAGDAFFY